MSNSMTRDTGQQAMRYWFDSPVFGRRDVAQHEADFGPTKMIGAHLKRSSGQEGEDDFGVWLGRHGDIFVVGIKDVAVPPTRIIPKLTACECFETMDDVLREWILD